MPKPILFSIDLMDSARRRRFVAYFEGPPLKGDRAALMKKTGLTKGRMTQLFDEKEPFGELAARRLAVRLGLGESAFLSDPAPATGGVSVSPVAQDLSHQKHSDALPEITWESLVGNVPDSLFVLVLRDDALAPDYPRGTSVVWSKTRQPRPGRLVLVRDKYGRDHVRAYHEGRAPGQWLAASRNPAFPNFDPAEDGLQILAVHRGILDDDDERPALRGQKIESEGSGRREAARPRKRQ